MRKALLSLAVVSLVAVSAFAGKYNTVISVGDKAPVISGLPAVQNGEETSFSLSDVKEDVVVVVFLANHCPAVKGYEDRLIEFTAAYKDKGVKVVGISVSRQEEDKIPGIKDYTKEHKSNYIYAYDETQATGKAYGAVVTPQFFVLDKSRIIRYTGALDDNGREDQVKETYLKNAVDAVLSGKTPAVEETRAKGCSIGYKKS
jgi:peroxiredoxin